MICPIFDGLPCPRKTDWHKLSIAEAYGGRGKYAMLSPEDANKIIRFLSAAYFCTDSEAARKEFNRLANELRKASGQPEE